MSAYDNKTVSLTIIVLDTATIFEGAESIYRYDLPGIDIVEGRALNGVIEQVERMFPGRWPDLTVAVVADSSGGPMSREAVKIIRRQLQVHNVSIAEREPSPVLQSETRPDPVFTHDPTAPDDDIFRPVDDGASFTEKLKEHKGIAAVAAAFLIMVIIVVWILIRGLSAPADDNAAAAKTTAAAAAQSPAAISAAPSDAPSSTAAALQTLEVGGLRVKLPEGFTHTEDDDGRITATGPDPNLRIIMYLDPLFEVPAPALFAEMRSVIDSDPTLSDPHESNGRLSYVEKPGDDSEVFWQIWVEDGEQISLGCHTRVAASVAERAACRIASESLEKVS